MAEKAIIELGSNVNPEAHIPRAIRAIKALGTIRAVSTVYKTEPFGPAGQPPFINAALALETKLEPLALRQALRQIETELGRQRGSDKYTPREIDLDLCLYGQRQIDHPELKIPDPDILERPYLARTIAEIAPDLIHPGIELSMAAIADNLDPEASLEEDHELTRASHEAWQTG